METGQQARLPLRFELPETLAPGPYELTAGFHFSNGDIQQDRIKLNVMAPPKPRPIQGHIALFDPAGETLRLLDQWDIPYVSIRAGDDLLSDVDLLIVGKHALTLKGPAPDIRGVREGLKVIVFEQGPEVLEQRLGLDQGDMKPWFPGQVVTSPAEHISAYFTPFGQASPLAGVSPAEVHNRDPRTLPLIAAGAQIVDNGVLALGDKDRIIFCQLVPWQFSDHSRLNIKRTYRRVSCLVSRILANLGVSSRTPLLDRFHQPVTRPGREKRWSHGLYLDQPQEWDDPYRFFRW